MAGLIVRRLLLSAFVALTTADTMPLRHAVVAGTTVRIGEGGLATLEVRPECRYVGGQRFVLKGVADAEQHAFVAADAAGNIQRFYWVQFEHYLPASRGVYDYGEDTLVTRDGRDWRANVRRDTAPPDPMSDRGQLYAWFARAGLRPPLPALRTRLVYVTSADRRSELMIIYAEASPTEVQPTASEADAMIARAQTGFRIQ